MTSKYTGGCACRAIRYETSAEPVLMAQCQCRDCQYASGTGHCCGLAFPTDQVSLTGEAKYYEVTAESGQKVSRGFCANCGSPLFATNRVANNLIISAASLDDPSVFSPICVFFASRGHEWDLLDPDLTKYDTEAPAGTKVPGHNV